MTTPIRVVRTTASTNADVRALAEQGAAHGTAVRAWEQTQGRGRLGRQWLTAPGEAVLLSVLIRRPLPADRVPMMALATAVAITDVIPELRIKWPNDLLCPSGGKVSGILCEAEFLQGRLDYAVLGVGLNVHGHPGIAGSTCWDEAVAERAWSVPDLAEGLHRAILARMAQLETRTEPVLDDWRSRSHTLGQRVRVSGLEGVALDLDRDGALLLQTESGVRRIVAGDVRPA